MKEQYTIRAYDPKVIRRIESTFKKCEDYYPNKNSFLVDCICRGMTNVERDIFGVKNVQDLEELYKEISTTTETLNKLIKLSEENARENMAQLLMNEKLLSCNYNMLLGISNKVPYDRETVEKGSFDELPSRFKLILKEILEELKNKK